MSLKKSQKIVWEIRNYPKDYLKTSLVFMVLFLIPIYFLTHFLSLTIIFAFSIEIIYGILLYNIWMIIITILFVPLSGSILNQSHFSIKFTEKDLYITPELLMRPKNYSLSTLSRVEIILGHRYFYNRKLTSGLQMLIKLITLNGETKKTYLFAKEFSMKWKKNMRSSAQIKQQLISLRDGFESNFRNLKTFFPNIVSLKDEDFHIPYWQAGMAGSKRGIFFIIFWFTYLVFCGLLLFLINEI